MPASHRHIHTVAARAGEGLGGDPDALSVPIVRAAVHRLPGAVRGAAIHEGEEPGYFYGRAGNPTTDALESAMCALEGGEAALATASGMAALTTLFLTLLAPGDHLLAPRTLYASSRSLLEDVLGPLGIRVSRVDMGDPEQVAAAVRPETRVVFVETPANPTLDITDLAAVSALARRHGVATVADNTFATPVNTRPIDHGIDYVVHSATKYLGGHSDVLAGVIVGDATGVERARRHVHKHVGAVLSPDAAWLVLRGIKTLPLRVERHGTNAAVLAERLASHPAVRRVCYPGLDTHPGHAIAVRQMRGFGGVLSFDVGDADAGRRVVDALELVALAVSLGDTASLIQHSASMTHAGLSRAERDAAGIVDGLLRLSVGLEHVEDLWEDLRRALDVC